MSLASERVTPPSLLPMLKLSYEYARTAMQKTACSTIYSTIHQFVLLGDTLTMISFYQVFC